jgi:hypothetical protein
MGPVAVTIVLLVSKTCATIAPFESKPNNGKHVDPVPDEDVDKWSNVPDNVWGWIQNEIENDWLLMPSEVKPHVWKYEDDEPSNDIAWLL